MSRQMSLKHRYSVPNAALVGSLLLLSGSGCAHTVPLTVMTFNIRYGTANDGLNSWKYRRPMVVDVINKHDPDVMGLQEVLAFQRDELLAALPGFDCVGVGRDDGKDKGEFAPILFKRDRFELVDKGWFWLSETPDKPGSIGWDAACPRIATWVRLRTKQNVKTDLWVLNTHFDHKGEKSRANAGLMLKAWVCHFDDCPRLVMGDFNSSPRDPCHAEIVNAIKGPKVAKWKGFSGIGFFTGGGDVSETASCTDSDVGTFNGFEGVHSGDRIDWIMHSNDFQSYECMIDRTSRNGRYPSDHFPVIAKFKLIPKVGVLPANVLDVRHLLPQVDSN